MSDIPDIDTWTDEDFEKEIDRLRAELAREREKVVALEKERDELKKALDYSESQVKAFVSSYHEALEWRGQESAEKIRERGRANAAERTVKSMGEALEEARKSLEAIQRKTKRFLTGNLWTVKRDAEEGLAALASLAPSAEKQCECLGCQSNNRLGSHPECGDKIETPSGLSWKCPRPKGHEGLHGVKVSPDDDRPGAEAAKPEKKHRPCDHASECYHKPHCDSGSFDAPPQGDSK